MAHLAKTHQNYLLRKLRTRSKIANSSVPRLSVHRTLRHIYAQIIDDVTGKTIASASDLTVDGKGKKSEVAEKVGAKIAELAKAKKISAVRFDRGGRKYHGRIAALAKGARDNGLQF